MAFGLTDKTLESEARGEDVVNAVVEKLDRSGIFLNDQGIMKRIAFVESKFGQDKSTYRKGYHGGIWQVDAGQNGGFTRLTRNRKQFKTIDQVVIPKVEKHFGIEWSKITYEDLRKPLYSAIFGRLVLMTINKKIPDNWDLKAQAQYWKKWYNSGSGKGTEEKFIRDVEELEKEYNCSGRMDLAIVMDGSGSIISNNFEYAKTFAVKLIQMFSLDSVRVAFIVFSASSEVIFGLDSNQTKDQMKDMIMEVSYPEGLTFTNLGIRDGVSALNRGQEKEGVPKVMVILTDGNPTCSVDDMNLAVDLALSHQVTILAVGIGSDIFQDNLVKMTSNHPERVFLTSSYEALSKSFKLLSSETCKVPQKPKVGHKLTDSLNQFEKRFLEYALPHEGITITINPQLGETKGYYSYTDINPSSALNDGEFEREVFIPFKGSKSDRFKREVTDNSPSNETVFVTIEGQKTNNTYTVASELGDHTSGSGIIKSNVFVVFLSTIVLIICKFMMN